jgi:hypothetical protein
MAFRLRITQLPSKFMQKLPALSKDFEMPGLLGSISWLPLCVDSWGMTSVWYYVHLRADGFFSRKWSRMLCGPEIVDCTVVRAARILESLARVHSGRSCSAFGNRRFCLEDQDQQAPEDYSAFGNPWFCTEDQDQQATEDCMEDHGTHPPVYIRLSVSSFSLFSVLCSLVF